jgi:hypothetical protein
MTQPDDYNVVMIDFFPGDVRAAVRVDANGYPTVYINDYLSPPAKREALEHELTHIERGDITNHLTIYDAEHKGVFHATMPSVMARSFRDLTTEEEWKLTFAGVVLMHNAFPSAVQYTPAPPTTYDRTPKEGLFDASR